MVLGFDALRFPVAAKEFLIVLDNRVFVSPFPGFVKMCQGFLFFEGGRLGGRMIL